MDDNEKKVIEGDFEFEAVIPDELFPQRELKALELPNEMFDDDVKITEIILHDLDSLDSRKVVFDDEDAVKDASITIRRWLSQPNLLPRHNGVKVYVTATMPVGDEGALHEEIETSFQVRVGGHELEGLGFRDMMFNRLIESRVGDFESAMESRYDRGVEDGEASGKEAADEESAAELAECINQKDECEEDLSLNANAANWRELALEEIGRNAIIIRGLNYGSTEEPLRGSVHIYGPTGELLRKIEGDEMIHAWDDFGKNISEESIGTIKVMKADLPEKAPREMLNQITLRVRSTNKGPQITQRTGPSISELKNEGAEHLEGLGALVKGVFRARPAGITDVQSLAEEKIVEVTTQVAKPQPPYITELGVVKSIFIRGYVTQKGKRYDDPVRFVDIRPDSLDQADELIWKQDWKRGTYGNSTLTIGFTSRSVEMSGEIKFPFSGMFRDLVKDVAWKSRLDAMENRHKQDLENENRQLGVALRRNEQLKEMLAARTREVLDAGLTPKEFELEPDEQGRLFKMDGTSGANFKGYELGALKDGPGFPRAPDHVPDELPHGLPACVVGKEKACMVIEAKERLVQYGAAVLSTPELVSIALGIPMKSASDMLHDLGGIVGLFKAPAGLLIRTKGVGLKTALRAKAIAELSIRLETSSENLVSGVVVDTPEKLEPFIRHFRLREKESFWLALLDARNRLKSIREVCQGTIDACSVHPRDIFSIAILEGATGVILIHNHPSGNPRPSTEDTSLTHRMREGAKLLGIRLLDHLIVAGDRVISLRSLGLW